MVLVDLRLPALVHSAVLSACGISRLSSILPILISCRE